MKAFPNNRSEGMDLRDYFAAKAMQAMLTNEIAHSGILQVAKDVGLNEEIALSKMSYALSDAMMKARVE